MKLKMYISRGRFVQNYHLTFPSHLVLIWRIRVIHCLTEYLDKMIFSKLIATAITLLTYQARAQLVAPAAVYTSSFNSSFALTQAQIQAAELESTLATSFENVVKFDRSQLAFGGPRQDDFYTLPPLTNTSGPLKPGVILKVQPFTDPTAYSIPPNTALSRILYTTTTYNGTVIPASGFVLWPYIPRVFSPKSKKASVVVWTHGTSGWFVDQAPSSHRGMYYANTALFELAELGYAVFAPDYAGLGISKSWDGSEIVHQYLTAPASAGDALYGLRAALAAFPDQLEQENFVIFGHSQGGGVAWAAAELLSSSANQFRDLLKGYKGTIAASPTTDALAPITRQFLLPVISSGVKSIFPDFDLSDWLTPLAVKRVNLAKEVQAGISAFMQLVLTRPAADIIKPDFDTATPYARLFGKSANPGRKKFQGPLLVLQGTEDVYVDYNTTAETVKDTLRRFPKLDLEFYVAQRVGHSPILHATKQYWTKWIEDRLSGKAVAKRGSVRTDIESFLPDSQYLKIGNSFLAWAGLPEFGYQVVLGL
ncbi:Alpha/Beta hydrolase protein [Podospora australis]|uniref:Alpha/Beta hydrolase protein n=1 Tax=Podospora australis TaxID=1536484 RepID=A0AAN7AFI2_9PEZI|nr:Alpha/Beta hydrolase protein [Podospora australis]